MYRFTEGHLDADPPGDVGVDVHLSAEPVTQLLLSYGRVGPIRPALTGG
ncbi:hypothetical protein [Salinifilum ghardaiensis]